MKSSAEWNLPLMSFVDCVVAGGSVAAVAAALELRRLGRRVLVVAERAYLGEESAAVLAVTPDGAGVGEDSLQHALEARDRKSVV